MADSGSSFRLEGTADGFSANIVSLLHLGACAGSLLAGPLGDKLGRKIGLSVFGWIFCVGSLMQTVCHGSTPVMFIGRVIGGMVSLSIFV